MDVFSISIFVSLILQQANKLWLYDECSSRQVAFNERVVGNESPTAQATPPLAFIKPRSHGPI